MTYEQVGLWLMTCAVAQFTVVPLIADLSRSHAANPGWPGHARFHVVAQVLTSSSAGAVVLFLLWGGLLPLKLAVCLSMMISLCVLGSFFAAALCAPLYGGAVRAPSGVASTRIRGVDGNVLNFSLALALLLAGRGALLLS
jgi:hypothetical protein